MILTVSQKGIYVQITATNLVYYQHFIVDRIDVKIFTF